MGALGAFPFRGANQHFAIPLALTAMKLVNRHAHTLPDRVLGFQVPPPGLAGGPSAGGLGGDDGASLVAPGVGVDDARVSGLDRCSTEQPELIHVPTPKRGSTHFMSTNQPTTTAARKRTSFMTRP